MIWQCTTSRRPWNLCVAVILIVVSLSACGLLGGDAGQGGLPSQPGPAGGDDNQSAGPGGQDAAATPTVSIPPTTAAGFEPGTVILEETFSSGQAGGVEWTFDSLPGQVIKLEASLISGSPAYRIEIIDKFANVIAALEAAGRQSQSSIEELRLPYEGAYTVRAVPVEGVGTVRVTLSAIDSASGGGELSGVGQSLQASMNVVDVFHLYEFPLIEGEVVNITAEAAASGQPDLHVKVFGPDGNLMAVADDVQPPDNLNAAIRNFVAPLEGTYRAIVSNVQKTTGDYTFKLESASIPPEPEGEPDISYNRDYRVQLFEGSNLTVTFDGEIGDVIQIETFGVTPDVDVDLRLYSPFGQVVAYALDAGFGEGEAFSEIQLPYTGRYTLEMTPVGEGEASFRIDELTRSDLTGGGVFGDESSGSLIGRVNADNVFHFYQFDAFAGDRITLEVTSESVTGEMDLGFALIGPDGLQKAFADNSAGGDSLDPELTTFEVSQTGVYTIIVYSFNNARGTYTLNYVRER